VKRRTCNRIVRSRTGAEVDRMIRAGKNVVVQYASPNCGACAETNPHIDRAATHLCDLDVEVVRVNTDMHDQFASAHGVEELPTIEVFRGGKRVGRTVGADKADAFVQLIRKALGGK